MTGRPVYVYRLVISYPEGSDAPGWKPACWGQMLKEIKDRSKRRAARDRGFYWPRERLFLSADGAWHRAWLLTRFGARVEMERSEPVTWPDYGESANGRDWEAGSTAARWEPPEEDPLDASARYLYPAPESTEQDVVPFMPRLAKLLSEEPGLFDSRAERTGNSE